MEIELIEVRESKDTLASCVALVINGLVVFIADNGNSLPKAMVINRSDLDHELVSTIGHIKDDSPVNEAIQNFIYTTTWLSEWARGLIEKAKKEGVILPLN